LLTGYITSIPGATTFPLGPLKKNNRGQYLVESTLSFGLRMTKLAPDLNFPKISMVIEGDWQELAEKRPIFREKKCQKLRQFVSLLVVLEAIFGKAFNF